VWVYQTAVVFLVGAGSKVELSECQFSKLSFFVWIMKLTDCGDLIAGA